MNRLPLRLKHRDTVAGLVLLGCCAAAWWLTAGFEEVPAMLSQNVPPTFFPRLVILTAALLGVGLALGGMRSPAPRAGGPAVADAADAGRRADALPPVFWGTVCTIAAAGVSMDLLGTLPTLGLLAVVLSLAWGERRYRLIAALGLGLPAGIYAVFVLGLGVRFPAGRVWVLLLPG